MNPFLVILAVMLIVAAFAGAVGFLVHGVFEYRGGDHLMGGMELFLGFVCAAFVFLLLGFATMPTQQLVAGRCYEAVTKTSTSLIPIGKVFIPSTTENIVLLEVAC